MKIFKPLEERKGGKEIEKGERKSVCGGGGGGGGERSAKKREGKIISSPPDFKVECHIIPTKTFGSLNNKHEKK